MVILCLSGVGLWYQISSLETITYIIKPWNFVSSGGPIATIVINGILMAQVLTGIGQIDSDNRSP